ncbi:MAG: hypothetical protein ACPLQP_08860 [Moorellaceae bacterium]
MRRITIIRQALQELTEMFASCKLPEAVALTVIKPAGDRPSDNWSLGNRLLMLLAGTEDARGYRQWQQVGRHVKKGSKAFYIFGPYFRGGRSQRMIPRLGGNVRKKTKSSFTSALYRCFATRIPRAPHLVNQTIARLNYPLFTRLPNGSELWWNTGRTETGSSADGIHFGERKILLQTRDVKTFFHELAHAVHAQLRDYKGVNTLIRKSSRKWSLRYSVNYMGTKDTFNIAGITFARTLPEIPRRL